MIVKNVDVKLVGLEDGWDIKNIRLYCERVDQLNTDHPKYSPIVERAALHCHADVWLEKRKSSDEINMNTKKVEIEIPADMDVELVEEVWTSPSSGKKSIAIRLVKQQPRRWTFEEILDEKEKLEATHFFSMNSILQTNHYILNGKEILLRKVENVNT